MKNQSILHKCQHITTCTELPVDDTNNSTSDNKYPWLESYDVRRNMKDTKILQMKLNLKDSVLDEMTPATLSPTPLAYEKPIHPT